MSNRSSGDRESSFWGCFATFLSIIVLIGVVSAFVEWMLSLPFFLGHIILGLLSIFLVLLFAAVIGNVLLEWLWPTQILLASHRASETLNLSLFRYEGRLLILKYIKEVDAETRMAKVLFQELNVDYASEEELIDIFIHPKKNHLSNRVYALFNPSRAYLESFDRAGLQLIPHDSPDGSAYGAIKEIFREVEQLTEMRTKAESYLADIAKVLSMSSSNELTIGIRKRAAAAEPKAQSIIEKIDARGELITSSSQKLIELISVPPSLRGIESAQNLEMNILECKGSADDLFEEVRLFEAAFSELMDS